MDDAPWLAPIESDRLTLLPAHSDHAEAVASAAMESLPELAPWSGRNPAVRDLAFYLQATLERAASTTLGTVVQRHAFTRAAPTTFIAAVSLKPWHDPTLATPPPTHAPRVDQSADLELGFWCRTSETRQGYASEAVSAVVTHALEQLHARALWMRIAERNSRSRRLAARLGFTEAARIDFPPSPEWGDAATVLFMRRLAQG